jgi:tetratricopeptide (TPR) repeat protein
MNFSRKAGPLLLIFFAFRVLLWAQAQNNQIEAIRGALREKEYDKAVQLSRSALREGPENPQLWALQGVALASEGDTKSALAAFQRALKLSPNDLIALEGAAQIEYQAGSREAVPLLKRLLQLHPDDPTGNAMLAVMQYRSGDCAGAANHFAKAGALIDSQVDALHAYATCLVRLKQVGSAVPVFERAQKLLPDDPRERQLLASIQLMAGQPQAAIDTLKPLLDTKAANAETLELASAAYEDLKDTPNAVAALREAILLDPRNVDLYLDFANISFAHNSFQVGIDVVNTGIRLEPQAAPLYLARGVLYVQLADYDRAQADFEKSYELDPSQSLSAAAQGLAALQANDLDGALATVQAKLAHKPNDAGLLYLQADILAQKGATPGTLEFNAALESAKKALSLRPGLAPARAVLAKLYMQMKEYRAAIEQCRKALQLDPNDQTSLYRLIQALRNVGEKEEIPQLLQRLAALREQAAKDERERNRYKLIEGETSENPGKP